MLAALLIAASDCLEAVAETVGRVGDKAVANKLGLGEGEGAPPAAFDPPQNTEVAVVESQSDVKPLDWLNDLAWTNREEGKLDRSKPLYNSIIWLKEHKDWVDRFCFNEFTQKTVIVRPLEWDNPEYFQPRELDNRDLTRIKAHLERHGMQLQLTTVKDAIEVASERNSFNPVREYFERLEWDGTPRLDGWLANYCGCCDQDQDYIRAVGSKWMIAAVRRVYYPGTPFHHMLVLEGPQGNRKSTILKELATFGPSDAECFFTDRFSFSQVDDKYAALHLLGHIIIEFQEMTGLSAKDRNKIKQWITQTHDEMRKPFAATTDKYPRQFVLAGTTNDSQWMVDPTGNRRFWPVAVTAVDIERLKQDKEQLWAEAVHRFRKGELWYINDTDPLYSSAEAEQRKRYIGDAWDDVVMDGVEVMLGDVTLDRILSEVIKLPRERWSNREKYRISTILRSNGWESVSRRVCGKVKKVWIKNNGGFAE